MQPARREVLLPGLVILERFLARCQARALEYSKSAVRDGLAYRLIRLLGSYRREDLHATLLLRTQVMQ